MSRTFNEWKNEPLGSFKSWKDKQRCLRLIEKAYEAAPKGTDLMDYRSPAFEKPRVALEALGIEPLMWFYGWENYGNGLALYGRIPGMSPSVASMFDGIYGEGNW